MARGGQRWQEVAQGGTRRWYKVGPHSKALEDCKVEEGGTGHSEGESDRLQIQNNQKTSRLVQTRRSMVLFKGQRGKSELAIDKNKMTAVEVLICQQ